MRKVKSYFLAVLLLLGIPLLLSAQQVTSIEQRADSLYQAFEEEKALKLYQKILENNPEDYRALWRASFLYSRIGNRLEKENEQREYFNRAIKLADRALKVDSTDAESNFVKAVAMGRKALISGARERVAASRAIKKYADRAIKYDSTHAGAWHVLGRWHYKVDNLNWIERAAANALFGGIPEASSKKAKEALEKAISLNGDYILYYLDLAKVYRGLGREKEAISTCKTALQKPLLTPDDEELKKECRKLINDLQ